MVRYRLETYNYEGCGVMTPPITQAEIIVILHISHAQYILWSTDPDKGFLVMSEEKNKNKKLLA